MTLIRPAALSLLAMLLGAADEKPPANLEIIYLGEAIGILGRTVTDPTDAPLGQIVNVLVDDQGQPRAAVIDFGGFMGIGKRRIAVAWRALHFQPSVQNHHIRIDMTADQIKATPEYNPAATPQSPPITMAVPPPGSPAAGK